jgi:MFS transporter, DHA2 family, multidrug resistance protein
MTDGAQEAWQPRANKWLIAVVVTGAAFMEILDTTIVNVSLRHISGSLSVSYDEATWSLTSYLVANGIVLTISGWLGRVLGRQRYFLICLAMFTVSSLLCGLSESLAGLVVFRSLQGFFGGGLQPTQQSILLDTFGPAQRAKAFGLTAVATVVAPAIGPALGGWITDNYSWRWIFFINVPIGALTFFAVLHLVEDPPWTRPQGLRHTDVVGLSLIALGLGSLQVMMDRGEIEDWFDSGFIITFAVLAAVGLLGAVTWLLYARRPVINLRVLADRNFAVASILMASMAFILYGSVVALPQLTQQQLGYDATLSGLVLSPGALLVMALIPVAAGLQRVMPVKYLIALGFGIAGLAMFYSSRLTPDVSFRELVIMRMAQSAGLAFLFAPLTTIAFVDIDQRDRGDASALFTMFRNVSGSLGISITTAIITMLTQAHLAHFAPHLTPLDQGYAIDLNRYREALIALGGRAAGTIDQTAMGQIYQASLTQAAVLAYTEIFEIAGVLAFLALPVAFLLSGGTGNALPAEAD